MKKDLGAEHIIPEKSVRVCIHELECACVFCNKAHHAVFCFLTLFISFIIIFLNLIILILRRAVSVGTAMCVCLCVLTECVCLFCMQSVERDRIVFVLYFFKSFMIFFSLCSFFFLIYRCRKEKAQITLKKSQCSQWIRNRQIWRVDVTVSVQSRHAKVGWHL